MRRVHTARVGSRVVFLVLAGISSDVSKALAGQPVLQGDYLLQSCHCPWLMHSGPSRCCPILYYILGIDMQVKPVV
jgi:hypothetical protein